jgi:hypothetical protein
MNDERPDNLKIGGILLKSTLGFLMLYFGIRMYVAIPELEELDHTTGTFMFSEKGIRLEENFNMMMMEEFHFTREDSSKDSIAMTNITKANEINEQLHPGDKITFWYPPRILPSDRGKEMLQLSVNDKALIPYEPNRAIPIFMICGGVIIVVLFIFLIKSLFTRRTT